MLVPNQKSLEVALPPCLEDTEASKLVKLCNLPWASKPFDIGWSSDVKLGLTHYPLSPRFTPALVLLDVELGVQATITTNLQEYELFPPYGYVFIKNWGENVGLLEAMAALGYLEDIDIQVPAGYCQAQVAKLVMEHFNDQLN